MKIKPGDLNEKEKAALLQGTDSMYTHPVERLAVPRLSMADGPHGLRKQIGTLDNGVTESEPATAFPTSACTASSWDPENARKIGRAIGEECRFYGIHMLLGPGLNIKRNPLCGRNFEYYSEDPLLSGEMGASFVFGLQKEGVSACIKHFALNNQENFRFVGDSVVDERALREIYLKPFEIVTRKSRPGAVMTAYNRINGTFASENRKTITDILRDEWGFDGIVMSDWGGTHDRVEGIRAGEDLEMPGDTAVNLKSVYDALCDGSLAKEKADACIARILSSVDRWTATPRAASFDREAHAELAAAVAADSAVLMKNDGTLPLSDARPLCVVGDLFTQMRYQGAGSSMIRPTKVITHRDAFDARGILYAFARGYSAGADPLGPDAVREALSLAANYDTILLYLGLTDFSESEGGDRPHMRLPEEQLRLAEALCRTQKKIVVVLSGGSPVELPFADRVSAILNLYLPGQCGGEAAARLLFGEVSPSGKLAETWYARYSDVPYGDEYSQNTAELYRESVYVGYRYAVTAGVRPAFSFGFGLSYTSFAYDDLTVSQSDGKVILTLTVSNTGTYNGAEVVEVYVGVPAASAVWRPERELRAFAKVRLCAGESKTVSLFFAESELSFYHPTKERFVLENGTYNLLVGTSSEDIRLTATFTISSGEDVTFPYDDDITKAMTGAGKIDRETFARLLGRPLPAEPPALPLTLESRFVDFRRTFMGRILYAAVCGVAEGKRKKAQRMPPGLERDNRLKGALFLQRIFDTNCMRSLSHSAGRSFPWNIAGGFVLIGNGHLLRGLLAMCKTYRIKGEKKK